MSFKNFFCAGIFLLAVLTSPQQASLAQELCTFRVAGSHEYVFNQRVAIWANIESPSPVIDVTIFLKSEDDYQAISQPAARNSEGFFSSSFDLSSKEFVPFSQVYYWFHLELADGSSCLSASVSFSYVDNRFEWQTLSSGVFNIHWYAGEITFGQAILDTAVKAVPYIQQIIPLPIPNTTDIYVYASKADLFPALPLEGSRWSSGHANPILDVIVLSLPPDDPESHLDMDRILPHEIAHLMLSVYANDQISSIPLWFNEGLASLAEFFPDPDRQLLLEAARAEDSLLPLVSLCETFPPDASQQSLAYAEAADFMRYLSNQYGAAGLSTLADAFLQGSSCENGTLAAFGDTLGQMEKKWLSASGGGDNLIGGITEALPSMLIFLIPLIIPAWLILARLRSVNRSEE